MRVASLEDFGALWSFVAFDFQGKPAFVTRVPRPETRLGKRRTLEVKPDLFLIGLLRECSHNGCPVNWSPTPSSEREFVCNCHGSHFRAANGERVAGIAPLPLLALQLETRDGAVYALRVVPLEEETP